MGCSIADLDQMSAIEYAAWEAHLDHFPPGDFYTQYLLAMNLCATLDQWKKKEEPRTDIFEVAPWLEEPVKRVERLRKRQEREREQAQAERRARAAQISERYRRSKALQALALERHGQEFEALPFQTQAALDREYQELQELN